MPVQFISVAATHHEYLMANLANLNLNMRALMTTAPCVSDIQKQNKTRLFSTYHDMRYYADMWAPRLLLRLLIRLVNPGSLGHI
jgi:hypothetical protein